MDASHDRSPYAPPAAPLSPSVADADAGAPLFKIAAVGIATFFGSVLAGGLIMAMNFRAMGKPEKFWPTIGLSLLALVATLLLGAFLPENFPGVVITVPTIIAMTMIAGRYQGQAITQRQDAGLPMRSNWLALGIALLVLLPILLLGIGLLLLGGAI
ncbi:hypothetical protein LDO26_03935 [Luteimonas sp. BDR2-5]|uniref:hypothetical protein n=1 Tax=Proluteimonas luteida TaxID=2878685 RepID=UPI001E5A9901|nr:hypothetical protein [Luteimonas sp. BDR2-5]MCD9027365.1 hypothetical protein [Luteimonas sp. BDR2-5]